MSEQHYFSETPRPNSSPARCRVELAGRKVTVTTANGIFSPSGIDKAPLFCCRKHPTPQGERMLDIGCGWGPITLTLAMLAPQAQVHAVMDVNSRSISLTERNAAALGLSNVTVGTPNRLTPNYVSTPSGRTRQFAWAGGSARNPADLAASPGARW